MLRKGLIAVIFIFGAAAAHAGQMPYDIDGGAVIPERQVPPGMWMIDPAPNSYDRADPPPAEKKLPPWVRPLAESLAEIIKQFFKGTIADPTGQEHPNPFENEIDQYVKQIASSRFQFLLAGAGSLRALNGPFYFNDMQGGLGVAYSITDPNDPTALLAIRVCPLYGEIAYVRVGTGGQPFPDMPSRTMLGSSAGIDARVTLAQIFEPGARFYVRPLWAMDGDHDFGVSIYAAVYVNMRIDKVIGRKGLPEIRFRPKFTYFDRGQAQRDVLQWNGPGQPVLQMLQRFWEIKAELELKY
jgi:hypothetical protein